MIKCFGGKCQCCGYNACDTALEFHHLKPETKEIALSTTAYSWDRTVKELKKCIMVCANCHREIHEGIREIDTEKQYFNEELALNSNPSVNKSDLYDTCPVCGKPKLRSNKYCSKQCTGKVNNNITYDWSKYDLVDLIDNNQMTKSQIAKELGCTWQAVDKRYKKLKKNNY
jgi:transcriptional regulator with GAF, ATPase, and Fis domain